MDFNTVSPPGARAYALIHGGSSLLVIFLLFELMWGIAQVLPVRASSRASPLPQGLRQTH